jgi:hypothetical protein
VLVLVLELGLGLVLRIELGLVSGLVLGLVLGLEARFKFTVTVKIVPFLSLHLSDSISN